MSMNEVASGQRINIVFLGIRNAGKSSLVNEITGQAMSVVSDFKGTTTDLVKKAMELNPLGPVVIVDTPGVDDEGELGQLKVNKSREAIDMADIAVLVVNAEDGIGEYEKELIEIFTEKGIPYVVVLNKVDLVDGKLVNNLDADFFKGLSDAYIKTSAITGEGIEELKNLIGRLKPKSDVEKKIAWDLVEEGDLVVMVTPIDKSAPKGRLILPQQNTLRELLDHKCKVIVCQETELEGLLSELKRLPVLVITDSQVFDKVEKILPKWMPLTSFSILFARYKGMLDALVDGADMLMRLKDGDRVLVAEGCTHHRQCEDIGTVKIPKWIDERLGVKPEFEWVSGNDFPQDLSKYKLIIHCGGCVMTETVMKSRILKAQEAGVPIVNYGVAIAKLHGILERSLDPIR